MIINLNSEREIFRNYIKKRIQVYLSKHSPTPRFVHIGFTFDQSGWVDIYFDSRLNASRDGEWTTHINPDAILTRAHWHEASELENLDDLQIIGTDGRAMPNWRPNSTLQKLAIIIGEFLRESILTFEAEGLFQPLFGSLKLDYCVEEFNGMYGWPINHEIAKIAELLKLSGENPSSHSI